MHFNGAWCTTFRRSECFKQKTREIWSLFNCKIDTRYLLCHETHNVRRKTFQTRTIVKPTDTTEKNSFYQTVCVSVHDFRHKSHLGFGILSELRLNQRSNKSFFRLFCNVLFGIFRIIRMIRKSLECFVCEKLCGLHVFCMLAVDDLVRSLLMCN